MGDQWSVGRQRAARLDQRDQPVACVAVGHTVDDDALARAGDARDHAARRLFQCSIGAVAIDERGRQQAALALAVDVVDCDDGEKGGMLTAAQRCPVGEARLPDLPRRHHPSLPPQKRQQP